MIRSRRVGAPLGHGGRLPALLFASGQTLVVLAWILASPPFANPDEEDHYLRALSLGRGEWLGAPAFFPLTPEARRRERAREAYVRRTATHVRVPGGLSPAGFSCNARWPERSASCTERVRPTTVEHLEVSYTGSYAPTAYLVPGAVLRAAHTASMGALLGRLGSCAVPLGLILVASLAAGAAGISRLGLLLVLPPTAVATIASLNPSGLEIAAGAALPVILLRLCDAPSRRWWTGAGVVGALLALSRPTGVLWLSLDAAALAMMRGTSSIRAAARAAPGSASLAGVAVVLGILGNLAWGVAHGPAFEPSLSAQGVSAALDLAPSIAHQIVGAFGYLDTWVPKPAAGVWWGLVLALVGLAFVRGTGRERATLALTVVAALGMPLALQAVERYPTGFDLQGRHVLPLLALTVAIACDAAQEPASRRPSIWLWGAGLLIAMTHVVSWWLWARRHATGSAGPLWFPTAAEWSPPLGWAPAITLVLVGAGALLAALLWPASSLGARHALARAAR